VDVRFVTALAPIVGYLIGSLPTANGIARLWGVDLRSGGTGNPGTNNARRLGGYGLAGIVLMVEVGKGVLAVFVGFQLGGDLGAALAGIGAVAGNVYNVWYRFRGGKGLGIAGGVLLAIWPLAFPIMVGVLVLATLVTGSSGQGGLIALVGVLILSIVWAVIGWSTGWGVSDTRVLILLSAGFGVTLAPKHLHDARSPATS
jgi:glycerol-3-phosphate acyltransferase PlsY